jgi:hypothetical protein
MHLMGFMQVIYHIAAALVELRLDVGGIYVIV